MIPVNQTDKTPTWRRNLEDILEDMENFSQQGITALISPEEMEILLDYINKPSDGYFS